LNHTFNVLLGNSDLPPTLGNHLAVLCSNIFAFSKSFLYDIMTEYTLIWNRILSLSIIHKQFPYFFYFLFFAEFKVKQEGMKNSVTAELSIWHPTRNAEVNRHCQNAVFSLLCNKTIYLKHVYSNLPFLFWGCLNICALEAWWKKIHLPTGFP
jgi:hypothetical protein